MVRASAATSGRGGAVPPMAVAPAGTVTPTSCSSRGGAAPHMLPRVLLNSKIGILEA